MKILLSSKIENLVIFNAHQLHLNKTFSIIDLECSTIFRIYPIENDRDYIPYAINVEILENKVICNSNHVKIINFPNYCEVEILPFKINNLLPILVNQQTFEVSNEMICVKIYQNAKNNLVIKNKNITFNDQIDFAEETNITLCNLYIMITYKKENSYFLYLYSIAQNKKVYHCEIVQFELDKEKNRLTIVKNLNDSLSHAEIVQLNLSDNFSYEIKGLTYLNENIQITCPEIAFFDCVKARNYKKAKELTTPALRSVLTGDILENYFKDFAQIKQSEVDFCFYVIPFDKTKEAKKIEFEMQNNLINNLKILYN